VSVLKLDSAGRLIEAAGCKGLRVGGAVVSEKHANFFVAEPGARAADVSSAEGFSWPSGQRTSGSNAVALAGRGNLAPRSVSARRPVTRHPLGSPRHYRQRDGAVT
jgi:hypothetical protein